MKFFALAIIGSISAYKMDQHNSHACDFIDDAGEEISTSLMPESFVQIGSRIRTRDEDDTVEGARLKFAMMQQEMDQKVAEADAKREE